MRRRILRAACLGMTVGTLMMLSIPPASAAQNGRQVALHFNVWSAKGDEEYNGAVAGMVIDRLMSVNPKPSTISFNEICWRQWHQIELVLNLNPDFTPYRYVAFAHWSINAGFDNCDGTIYGNVVVGMQGSPPAYGVPKEFSAQNSVREKRGAACLRSLAWNTTSCSTHYTNADDSGSQQTTRTKTSRWSFTFLLGLTRGCLCLSWATSI